MTLHSDGRDSLSSHPLRTGALFALRDNSGPKDQKPPHPPQPVWLASNYNAHVLHKGMRLSVSQDVSQQSIKRAFLLPVWRAFAASCPVIVFLTAMF